MCPFTISRDLDAATRQNICILLACMFWFLLALVPNAGYGVLMHEVSRSHKKTRHSLQDQSGRRAISPTKRPLPDNTQQSQDRQTSMPPAGFEPTNPASEQPQTYALDRAAVGRVEIRSCQQSVDINARHIPTDVYTEQYLLMMSSEPARNMQRLII